MLDGSLDMSPQAWLHLASALSQVKGITTPFPPCDDPMNTFFKEYKVPVHCGSSWQVGVGGLMKPCFFDALYCTAARCFK